MNDELTRIAEATAQRIDFLGESRERVQMNYTQAVELGATEPVVLLLDGRDTLARAVAEAIAGGYGQEEQVAAHVASEVDRGRVPAIFWGMPRDLAGELMARVHPELGAALALAHACAGYLVIIIAAGGYTITEVPPAPEELGL